MKQIQEYDNETDCWRAISASYSGLSAEDAKKELHDLRRWAREDNNGCRYRAVNVFIVPV